MKLLYAIAVFVFLLLLPLSLAQCSEGYLDNYRCFNGNVQREYQYTNCSKEWLVYRYCAYGCLNNQCIPLTGYRACNVSVSVSKPKDVILGQSITTTVSFTNEGSTSYVDFEAYLCNNTTCNSMNCTRKKVYLPIHTSSSVECEAKLNDTGDYRIKIVYGNCGYGMVYSNSFVVKRCTPTYLESRCFGNVLDRKYRDENCNIIWQSVKICENGCSYGKCLEKRQGIPKVILDPVYKKKRCEDSVIVFGIKNSGDEDSFNLTYYGDAVKWMTYPSEVFVGKGEIKFLISRISVPCNALPGEYDLTVEASNGLKDFDSSVIWVEREEIKLFDLVLIVVAISVSGILLFLLARKYPMRIFRRNVPEAF